MWWNLVVSLALYAIVGFVILETFLFVRKRVRGRRSAGQS